MFSYLELRHYWIKGLRNGNIRKLGRVERAFYKACMLYARRVGRILSKFVANLLQPIVERLKTTPKIQALRVGVKTIKRMYRCLIENRVLTWAPQVRFWFMDQNFIEYLGFMRLNMSITQKNV